MALGKASHKKEVKKNKKANQQITIDFKNAGIADVQFSSGMIRLSAFYRVHLPWQKCLMAAALGVLLAFDTLFFMKNTGFYSGGAVALCQGIARLINTVMSVENCNVDLTAIIYNILFWGLYLLFNIGLIIFFSFTMNKEFVYLSAIFICVTQVLGLALGFIPALNSIQLFGDTSTVNDVLKNYNVQCIIFYPNILPQDIPVNDVIIPGDFDWTLQLLNVQQNFDDLLLNQQVRSVITNENLIKAFSLVIYALMYSFIYAFCNAAIFIIGGSSMGTESLSIYLAEKKNKDIGYVLKIIQIICLISGALIGSYATGIISGNAYMKALDTSVGVRANAGTYASWQYICNANLVASFIFVIINSTMINIWFPTRKLVRVEVYTKQKQELLDNLRKHKCPHPTTVINSIGGFSGMQNNIIRTVLPVMSLTSFIKCVREVDKIGLVAVTSLDDCVGHIGIQKHINLRAAANKAAAEKKAKLKGAKK